jgi:hypothetical protein
VVEDGPERWLALGEALRNKEGRRRIAQAGRSEAVGAAILDHPRRPG